MSDIHLYQISTGTTTQITNDTARDQYPAVVNGHIAWQSDIGGMWGVFLLEIGTFFTSGFEAGDARGAGANDGYAELYLDDVLLESLSGLDNDTLYVESFKLGFTSRLVGKSISGTFYIDDVATAEVGHIGLP